MPQYILLYFKDLFYLLLEREEGREKEKERNINVWLPLMCFFYLETWPTTQACVLTGIQTGHPLVRRPALNPLSHTNQGHIFYILNAYMFITFLSVLCDYVK